MSRPFRWDVRHREQLGTLLPSPSRLPDHMDELRLASARIVARAGDAELVFVGRSLENVFDYLGAVLAGTSWSERPRLLSISLWSTTVADLSAEQIDGFRDHARAVGLAPAAIIERPHATAFIDVVASGGTMGAIASLLLQWSRDEGADVRKLHDRLRFVGLTRADPADEDEPQHRAMASARRVDPRARAVGVQERVAAAAVVASPRGRTAQGLAPPSTERVVARPRALTHARPRAARSARPGTGAPRGGADPARARSLVGASRQGTVHALAVVPRAGRRGPAALGPSMTSRSLGSVSPVLPGARAELVIAAQ